MNVIVNDGLKEIIGKTIGVCEKSGDIILINNKDNVICINELIYELCCLSLMDKGIQTYCFLNRYFSIEIKEI